MQRLVMARPAQLFLMDPTQPLTAMEWMTSLYDLKLAVR